MLKVILISGENHTMQTNQTDYSELDFSFFFFFALAPPEVPNKFLHVHLSLTLLMRFDPL